MYSLEGRKWRFHHKQESGPLIPVAVQYHETVACLGRSWGYWANWYNIFCFRSLLLAHAHWSRRPCARRTSPSLLPRLLWTTRRCVIGRRWLEVRLARRLVVRGCSGRREGRPQLLRRQDGRERQTRLGRVAGRPRKGEGEGARQGRGSERVREEQGAVREDEGEEQGAPGGRHQGQGQGVWGPQELDWWWVE